MTSHFADTPLVTLTDGVLTLPVSLEGKGNSLDSDAVDQAGSALRSLLAGDIDAGAVLLVGLGKNFCNGGNVPGFAAAEDRAEHVRELADRLHAVVRMLDEVTVPVVAAVSGWAAGAGASLAMAADFSIGGPDTRLLAAYPGIGLSPDGGMSWRLPRAVGQSVARAFILGNEPMDGARAYQLGLLTTFVEGDVRDAARALAVRLAAGPRESFAAAKALLRASEDATLSDHLDAERDSIARLAVSADGIEGVNAFVAKRSPEFGRG
ncbi:enoyl-CoA hydratase/isomerase family protein [Dietzia sp. ANT_WB102]|uniref:enoyl-CoA hydratase/isomerase family protein n=1 Tax=Dietzia sp. ANT_WB102 TaxID=2597345 RepID=UPI0011EC6645|nr:enoyl-CoA hydratase-related protein [Dietzia sp. ANT_WB102]KAA0919512.1 enoyl-CoA hydratase/isomerase family protein [Dietzia sp. ANT_WB102]